MNQEGPVTAMRPDVPRLAFAGLLFIYFLWIAYAPGLDSFLDNVNLPIHETGHFVFRPFGEFMGVAGGSIFQVILPAAFAGYFYRQEKFYSASVVLFWVGQSILNVYVYAADAVAMQLVLTSGLTGSEGGFHDWNYLLAETGLLGSTKTVAGIIRMAGTLVIIAAGVFSIFYSFVSESDGEEK
jgi:hypothetical protein